MLPNWEETGSSAEAKSQRLVFRLSSFSRIVGFAFERLKVQGAQNIKISKQSSGRFSIIYDLRFKELPELLI